MLIIQYTNPTGMPVQYFAPQTPQSVDWGGTNAQENSIFFKIDGDPAIYRKSGPLPTDWQILTTMPPPPPENPITFNMTNNSAQPTIKGNPLAANGILAENDITARANVVAMVTVPGNPGQPTTVQSSGKITMTTVEWSLVVEDPGGLVAGNRYYLSSFTGKITAVKPTTPGSWIVNMGQAISTTDFVLQIQEPVLIP